LEKISKTDKNSCQLSASAANKPGGDMATALDNLALQHRPMLVCYARALLGGDEHLAEDVVQDCFLTAHRRRDDFREGADMGRWLRGIARKKVLERRRAAASRPVLVDSRVIDGMDEVFSLFDPGPSNEESWRERLTNMLSQCVGKLPTNLHEAIDRVYRQGMSLRDAAAAIGATPAAVAQRLSRARELIRACVQLQRKEEA
jgi:RNA polymerase sigma-70 factor, ECF subfamily